MRSCGTHSRMLLVNGSQMSRTPLRSVSGAAQSVHPGRIRPAFHYILRFEIFFPLGEATTPKPPRAVPGRGRTEFGRMKWRPGFMSRTLIHSKFCKYIATNSPFDFCWQLQPIAKPLSGPPCHQMATRLTTRRHMTKGGQPYSRERQSFTSGLPLSIVGSSDRLVAWGARSKPPQRK